MPKYLYEARYSADGAKGVAREGGSGRRDAIAKLAESLGGKVESFYFAFGDVDAYIIMDIPDATSAVAGALAVAQTGSVALKTVPLISPEEMDKAAQKGGSYRPPGH